MNEVVIQRGLTARDVETLKNLAGFLNSEIATLPCDSRVRTMDEDIWGTAMYYRDMLEEIISKL